MTGAKITAWAPPTGTAAPWYPIAAFPVAATDVDVRLEIAGAHIVGCLAIERCSRRLAWHERHSSGVLVALMPWRHPSQLAAGHVPRRYPSAFQPLDGFAHPLPAPLAAPVSPPARPLEEPDPHPESEGDGWPYPGLALGLAAPVSREETEARVLRVLRTIETSGRVGHVARSIAGDWSREWYEAMRRMQRILEREELLAKGERDNTIETVRSAWQPSRRDRDDIATVQAWLAHLTVPHARRLLLYRAGNPPWSWRQISEREAGRIGSKSKCQALYQRAIDQLHAIATKGAAP